MRVLLTDDEAKVLLVAIRMTIVAETELVSMSPSKEIRMTLMDTITRLSGVAKKLGQTA